MDFDRKGRADTAVHWPVKTTRPPSRDRYGATRCCAQLRAKETCHSAKRTRIIGARKQVVTYCGKNRCIEKIWRVNSGSFGGIWRFNTKPRRTRRAESQHSKEGNGRTRARRPGHYEWRWHGDRAPWLQEEE